MDALPRQIRTMCGLVPLALAGCHSYPTYAPGPYGPTMAPPAYSTPPATLGPSTVVPQGTFPQETYPQGVVPQQGAVTPGGGTQIGSQSYTRNAPGYDDFQPPRPANPSGGDNPVPEYSDPTAEPQTIPQSGRSRQPQPVDPLGDGVFDSPGVTPFSPDGGMGARTPAAGGAQGVALAAASDTGLERSGPVQTSYTKPVNSVSEQTSAPAEPNPFDHDRENFRWVRGVVDYDADEKLWHILYDLTPDGADELGGEIALIGDEQLLKVLEVQDVVLVEGRLDDTCQDRFGKPCYRVDHLQRLQPQATFTADPVASDSGDPGLGVSPWAASGPANGAR